MFYSKTADQNDSSKKCSLSPEELQELLRPIIDPDIGVSIIDLGLVYGIENKEGNIYVEMTFTTPACPYGPQLVEEIKYILNSLDGVRSVEVNVVWDPPWSMDNINESTKLELGLDL